MKSDCNEIFIPLSVLAFRNVTFILNEYMFCICSIFTAIGTFLFDSRIGLFGSNPPKLSVEFIENLQGFFRLMQPLTYNLPVYKVFPTSEWKQFQTHADNVFRIGRSFVDKVFFKFLFHRCFKFITEQYQLVKVCFLNSFQKDLINQIGILNNCLLCYFLNRPTYMYYDV